MIVISKRNSVNNSSNKTINMNTFNHKNDDKTFDFVKSQTVTTICGNTEPYSLDSPVSCKHFRLTMNKPNSAGINDFFFYGFDCFGFVGTIKSPRRTRIKFSCNFARYKRNLIANNLLMILPSIINT